MEMRDIIKNKASKLEYIEDFDIDYCFDEVKQAVLNYCNIDNIPNGLKYTVINLTLDYLRYQNAMNAPTADSGQGGNLDNIPLSAISAVKIGDTQINLQGGAVDSLANAKKAHKLNLDGFLMNYQSQLNKFRRLVW